MLHKQCATRKKHERIRCPKCNAISKTDFELKGGLQYRICRNGHSFLYDYTIESIHHTRENWKIRKIVNYGWSL